MRAANQRYRAIRRAVIDEFKAVPCGRCGQEFPPVAMDVHHLPGVEKRVGGQSFSRWAMTVSVAGLYEELAKCEAICANCHRIYHWEDAQ